MKATLVMGLLTKALTALAETFFRRKASRPKAGPLSFDWELLPYQFESNWFLELPRDSLGKPRGVRCHLWTQMSEGTEGRDIVHALTKGVSEVSAVLNGDKSLWTRPEASVESVTTDSESEGHKPEFPDSDWGRVKSHVQLVYNSWSTPERAYFHELYESDRSRRSGISKLESPP